MTEQQKVELRTILESNKPSDFGINANKWSANNVRKLIQDIFKIDCQEWAVKKIVHRMNITFKEINKSHKSTLEK